MSTTAAVQPHRPLRRASTANAGPIARHVAAAAWERDQLTDRLQSLRRVLPVLAQEMAAARRQAAHLRLDNRRLLEQVRTLHAELESHRLRER